MARHLLDAICSGDERLAKDIILSGRYGCLDSQTSKRDGTALFFCCSRGLLELATLLVHRGASLDAGTKFLATPLHAAVDNNHFDVVRYLLDLGASLNAQTHRGDTPLHLAAYRGYTDIVHLLVQWGADVAVVNEFNMTPLKEAMLQGHCDIERYLKALQEFDPSSPSHTSSCHMVSLPPPTDLPSILPSQYKSPFPQPTSPKDFFQYKRPLQSHVVGPHSSTNSCLEKLLTSNPTTNSGQRIHPSSQCLETDGVTMSSELSGRVPEENTDPSISLSMAVSNLCVPSHDRVAQRRHSSASSISMISDCSNSGPRSDDSCAMSSISDVSSCGGDARREDFEVSEMESMTRCGMVPERRKSQPPSTISLKSNDSLISRTYSNPAPNSLSEFSDLFDSSLFSLGSLDHGSLGSLDRGSSSSSGVPRGRPRETVFSSDVNSVYYSKVPVLKSFNFLSGAGANNLSYPMTKESVFRKETLNPSSRFNDIYSSKHNPVPIIRPMDRGFSNSEDCADTHSWSSDNQPSNDLSSVRSFSSPSSSTTSSSPMPSMTFVNIPIHE